MNKTEAIRATKNANNRLKHIGDACLRVATQREVRSQEKERKLVAARLDRELTSEDVGGPALREAVATFWSELDSGAGTERQLELAVDVMNKTKQVRSDRWKIIEDKYGKIHHYFDRFGGMKRQYSKHIEDEVERPGCVLPVLILLLVAIVWWLW